MNCKQCQQKILESLADGGDAAAEISIHQESCAFCREFFAIQQNLFQSVDVALRSIANQPVPPRLLPACAPGWPSTLRRAEPGTPPGVLP